MPPIPFPSPFTSLILISRFHSTVLHYVACGKATMNKTTPAKITEKCYTKLKRNSFRTMSQSRRLLKAGSQNLPYSGE